MYTFFTAVTVRENKPSIEGGLNGAGCLRWLRPNRSRCSGHYLVSRLIDLSRAGSLLHIMHVSARLHALPAADHSDLLSLYLCKRHDGALTPPYWINMGAVAITTLAGARLIIAAPGWTMLNELVPFLKGFTLFFWAAATWWIPLLLALGFWRHVYKRFPPQIRPAILGHGLPVRHVYGVHFPTIQSNRLPALARDSSLFCLPRTGGLDSCSAWVDGNAVEKRSAS